MFYMELLKENKSCAVETAVLITEMLIILKHSPVSLVDSNCQSRCLQSCEEQALPKKVEKLKVNIELLEQNSQPCFVHFTNSSVVF